eukprot:6202073-Pleurochrysis_carterae.AAC.3
MPTRHSSSFRWRFASCPELQPVASPAASFALVRTRAVDKREHMCGVPPSVFTTVSTQVAPLVSSALPEMNIVIGTLERLELKGNSLGSAGAAFIFQARLSPCGATPQLFLALLPSD